MAPLAAGALFVGVPGLIDGLEELLSLIGRKGAALDLGFYLA